MAIRAWIDGDIRLAIRLLAWAEPHKKTNSDQLKSEENEDFSWQAA